MINVAFCYDENVIDYLKVVVCSLLINKKEGTHYNIVGICSNSAYTWTEEIKKLVNQIDSDSYFDAKICKTNYKEAYEIRSITKATYYRFDIAELYPHLDKVIYMDVDVLVLDDLTELWEIPLLNNYICGVKADVNIFSSWKHKKDSFSYWDELDGWRGQYVNAGVLLMNLSKIRESCISEKWKERISNQYFYQDQDILNITCKPSIGHLPIKYNFMTFYTSDGLRELDFQNIYSKEEIEKASLNPVIVHYAGKKPWYDIDTKRGNLWWDFVLECEYTKELFVKAYEKMNSLHVSIIVPVYNTEKYLNECLDSILAQDSKEYELICVNDGSEDNSQKIIESYQDKFNRLTVINQEHQGLSVARNSGIKIARGEYIYFVDSDDVVKEGFIKKAYDCVKENELDVLLFSFENMCAEDALKVRFYNQINKVKRTKSILQPMTGIETMYTLLQADEYYPVVWAQMVRRKVLIDNYLLFYRGIVFEDVLYTYRLLLASKRVMCITDIGYIKRIHSESICGREECLENVMSLWKNLKKIVAINKEINANGEKEVFVMEKLTISVKNQLLRHYERLQDKEEFLKSLDKYEAILFLNFVL